MDDKITISIPLVPDLHEYDTRERWQGYVSDMKRLGGTIQPWEPNLLKVNLDFDDPHYHIALHMYRDSCLLLTVSDLPKINAIAMLHGVELYVDTDAVKAIRRTFE